MKRTRSIFSYNKRKACTNWFTRRVTAKVCKVTWSALRPSFGANQSQVRKDPVSQHLRSFNCSAKLRRLLIRFTRCSRCRWRTAAWPRITSLFLTIPSKASGKCSSTDSSSKISKCMPISSGLTGRAQFGLLPKSSPNKRKWLISLRRWTSTVSVCWCGKFSTKFCPSTGN